MSDKTTTMESKVETVDLDLDAIFDGAATAEGVTVPTEETKTKGNIFSKGSEKVDMSFTEPVDDTTDLNKESETESKEEEVVEEKVEEPKATTEESTDFLDSLSEDDKEADKTEETKDTRGRKKISGISDVFS